MVCPGNKSERKKCGHQVTFGMELEILSKENWTHTFPN